jgi:hypothetical protein
MFEIYLVYAGIATLIEPYLDAKIKTMEEGGRKARVENRLMMWSIGAYWLLFFPIVLHYCCYPPINSFMNSSVGQSVFLWGLVITAGMLCVPIILAIYILFLPPYVLVRTIFTSD